MGIAESVIPDSFEKCAQYVLVSKKLVFTGNSWIKQLTQKK